MFKKIIITPESLRDPTPNVTQSIRKKIIELWESGYPVDKMSLKDFLSYGIDVREWQRDQQN